MSYQLFSTKRTIPELTKFNSQWSKSLNDDCLPRLREAISSTAVDSVADSSYVTLFHRHISTYFDTLSRSSNSQTILHLLFPPSFNSLDMAILFLGHVHPQVFTSLLRSLIKKEQYTDDSLGLIDVDESMAPWTNTHDIVTRIDDLELGMEPNLTALIHRISCAQRRYVNRWVFKNKVMDDDEHDDVKELVGIYRDANELRKHVMNTVLGGLNPLQKVLFFESLCELLSEIANKFQVPVPVVTTQQQQRPLRLGPGHTNQLQAPLTFQQQQQQQLPPPQVLPPGHGPVTTFCIFVGDLSRDVTEHILFEVFRARYASTKAARVPIDRVMGLNKGYGFVGFEDVRDQHLALRDMNGVPCTLRPMRIRLARNSSV
ncbi:hypothetical protein AALP_AAs74016U000400 [Arabis alpina]|uniref:RRM domain-containing protein n=1 Tax=Arabis alpina TaxID=50452 RepID=A0A087FY92_ARAAL|nr:hypothetical protein AALP_AAs74016U000400 [Arabis alpina]